MIFASHIFIFGFLPLFLAAYYTVPARVRSLLILIASYAFYGWWRIDYLAVVIAISLVSYVAAAAAVATIDPLRRTRIVQIGVALILCALGYFKYTHFIVGIASGLGEAFGASGFTLDRIILPIGISFLSFQSISYIIDVARRDAPPARNLIDFLAYIALFPQLIAGPVLRYKDLADQFADRTHSLAIFILGVRRFVIGLAMKLLIADTVAPLADRIFALSSPTGAEAWLGALAYAIQLFFDFAGYSAMAIGLGLMIGFRFVENFDQPYASHSITDFWRRWHISLSNWLRDYLYVPLGGNRRGALKTYRNLMLTMVLGGLWHGANWTFIFWGALHGAALAIERLAGVRPGQHYLPFGLGWGVTMLIVLVGWVMFRAPDVGAGFEMYGAMVGLNGWAISDDITYRIQSIELVALGLGALISVFGWRACERGTQASGSAPTVPVSVATVLLFVMSAVALSARTHSPFLYFQF